MSIIHHPCKMLGMLQRRHRSGTTRMLQLLRPGQVRRAEGRRATVMIGDKSGLKSKGDY